MNPGDRFVNTKKAVGVVLDAVEEERIVFRWQSLEDPDARFPKMACDQYTFQDYLNRHRLAREKAKDI